MKKAKSPYVVPIIFSVILALSFLLPLVPRIVKAVVPFPALKEATYLEGTFEYESEGEWPRLRNVKFYVRDANGLHEFTCGYFGRRRPCFTKPSVFVGQPIKVWTTLWFGRIQHEVQPIAGQRPFPLDPVTFSYADSRATYADPAYPDAKVNLLGPFLVLCWAMWLVVKEIWRRQEKQNRKP